MNAYQERKLSMYYGVKDYLALTKNATIVAALPNFAGFNTTFNGYVGQIETISKQQELDPKGIAKDKELLKKDLITKAADVARKVGAYAAVTNNTVLAGEVNYTESNLKDGADTELRDKAQIIYDKANANLAALATYLVTAAVLTALQMAITSYAASFAKPTQGRNDKKQATEQLKKLFADTQTLLEEKMDKIVEVVRLSQAIFYEGYQNARKIGKVGYRKLALKVLVLDDEQNAVELVVAKILPNTNTSKSLNPPKPLAKRKTSKKGRFQMKQIPTGTYRLELNKPGFLPKDVLVNIVDGETCELKVVLEGD